jgi:hypothetical protein
MTSEPDRQDPPARDEEACSARAAETERRRRRARVFGEVLPEGTSDERGDAWSEREPRESSDEWFRRQVPPHHG